MKIYVVCDGWCQHARDRESAEQIKARLDEAPAACPEHLIIEAEDPIAARTIYNETRSTRP